MTTLLSNVSTVLELLVYLVALCAALAAALPQSDAPWRKALDAFALNIGHAKNAVDAVKAVPVPKAAARWQDRIKR